MRDGENLDLVFENLYLSRWVYVVRISPEPEWEHNP